MKMPIRFSVLTVSDRSASGEREDLSGPALIATITKQFNAELVESSIVPDERETITDAMRGWLMSQNAPDLILTTGGTGLAPRDVTPEATVPLIERRHDGILELARRRCYDITPMTYLSRGVAGTAGRTLIINLPGSPRGVVQMIDAIADILPHAVDTVRGDIKDNHPNQPKPAHDDKRG